MKSYRLAFLGALLLVVGACGSALDGADTGPGATPPASPGIDATEGEVVSALRTRTDPSFPEPLVDVDQIFSGGPPPDGIPPIDEPQFTDIATADRWIQDDEPVVYLTVDGDTRIYPVQILIWHEIVNDTVGGLPVSVTYCPLCNSAVSYVRVVDGQETTFGTSGSLYNSALVMYDRLTESLWTHYDGRAVVGTLTGTQLEPLPSPLIAWADAKNQFADALVLDRTRTGARRDYGTNPYAGYDNPLGIPFLFRGDADDRAELMRRVVGVVVDGEATAWSLNLLQDGTASATMGEVGGLDIVIFWKDGQSSALDGSGVAGGRDVGSVGVFEAALDGRSLTFGVDGGGFRDLETGSTWTITGAAVEGELAGAQLNQVAHLDSFWFAWSSYQPDTELVEVR